MNGISQLILNYNASEIYDSNRAILQWMLQNLEKLTNCSIYTVAEETYSSTATISRLIKKLGYPNYHYFQKDIADDYYRYEYHNRIIVPDKIQGDEDAGMVMISIIKRFIDQFETWQAESEIDQYVEELFHADSVVLYLFEEVTSKFFFQYDMFMHGKKCEAYSKFSDIQTHCRTIEKDTKVLIFSAKRMTNTELKNICDTLKERGADICLVTDSRHYAAKHEVNRKFVIPGNCAGLDMLLTEIFLYYLTVKLRQKYDEEL